LYGFNSKHLIINKSEFKEILSVLFTNSLEALSQSERSNKRIDLILENSESGILLKFQNNGPKLDEKTVKKLFKSEISTKGRNRGFGLNYAKKCLLKYGGSIKYNPGYECGAQFIIELAEV